MMPALEQVILFFKLAFVHYSVNAVTVLTPPRVQEYLCVVYDGNNELMQLYRY